MSKEAEKNAYVEERRLRVIYELFDNFEYKRAVHECDKVIKKHGNKMGPTVLALRALAIAKLGRFPEAHKLLDGLIKDQPFEDATLSPISVALRELNRADEIIPLYEGACKISPTEEVLNVLFMLYVREQDRAKAKNVALRLHKMMDKRPYYFTAIMNQYLSGKSATDERQKAMCFTVALKMFERIPPVATAEINLKYMILRDSGRYKEAMEILEGSPAKEEFELLHDPDERFKLLTSLERWSEALDEAVLCFEKSQLGDHEWLRRIFEVHEKAGQTLLQITDSLLEKFDVAPPTEGNGKQRQREQTLCKIFIYDRLNDEKNLELCLNQYRSKFSEQIWAISDLHHVLEGFSETRRGAFFKFIVKNLKEDSMLRMKLQFAFGNEYLSDEARFALIAKLVEMYKAGPAPTRTSDSNPRDGFLELAADLVVERAVVKCGYDKCFLKMIKTLEDALQTSPNGFRLKLRLLWFYGIINNGAGVVKMSENLNVKYLQYESLGYLLEPAISRSYREKLPTIQQRMIYLRNSAEKEIAEGIVNSYKCGTFHKIEDMESLKPLLENSYEFANCRVKKAFISLFEGKSRDSAALPTIVWDKLHDNYDLSVLPKRYGETFETLESRKKTLQMRWHVLRLVLETNADSKTEILKDLRGLVDVNCELKYDLSNAFEFYVVPLLQESFEDSLITRVDDVTSVELLSLENLRRFVHMSSEITFILSCLLIIHAASSQLKSVLRKQCKRLKEVTLNLDLFDKSEPSEMALRDSYKEMYSSTMHLMDVLL